MITNNIEYRMGKLALQHLERALKDPKNGANDQPPLDRNAYEMVAAGVLAQARKLRQQLKEFDDLRGGATSEVEFDFLDLGDGLRLLRHLAGMTQAQLADKLGLTQQQIQRYEASGYERATLGRLKEVVWALDIDLKVSGKSPSAAAHEQARTSPELVQLHRSAVPTETWKITQVITREPLPVVQAAPPTSAPVFKSSVQKQSPGGTGTTISWVELSASGAPVAKTAQSDAAERAYSLT